MEKSEKLIENLKKQSKPNQFTELKKLVELCRKVGIKEFQGMGYSLKLSDDPPPSRYMRKKEASADSDNKPVADYQYSDEEMLLWSSGGIPDEEAP